MRASAIFTTLFSGLALVAADSFLINQDGDRFQACFVDGHEWWFCSKYLQGFWKDYNSLFQIGCGYYFQISKDGVVTTTSNNGCGYKAHCDVKWNSNDDNFGCELHTDHPNC
ncbi:hypothetical protein K469DRAFT_754030 [Zopfia rhizophila CBS 207.26]|uniref:Cyanovirin-N domain-containing protein n=1 Tax=Zopfia rhizophila CBS 207.26 TaxID=1314779 RepID=A0A6A6DNP7_9PEZI|nr:hypothetical protein K469DRAFT_754030 [Zopfia rhizophila CBS 207.26]